MKGREGGREKKIGALSIQEKFRFEFQKIPRAQWNGKFPRCTDTTQATARLIIVLIRGVQKSVTGTIIFQMEGEFRPDR